MSQLELPESPIAARSSCRVIEVNDLRELENFRLAWEALLADSPHSNFFQTLDWLGVYLRHAEDTCRLRALVVQARGKTIGILPLVVKTQATRVGPLRALTYPLDSWGSFYGPIGPNPTATLLAAWGHIQRTPRDWDLLELRWIDDEGTDRGRTWRSLAARGMPAYRSLGAQSALVELDVAGNWQAYWAARSSKWRTNVRRNEKRLAELGCVQHLRYRPLGSAAGDGDPRWDLYEICEQIARRSWQGSSTTGTTISHDSVRRFLRDAHAVAARVGGVDLNLLYLNDLPIAFNYCYHYRGQLFGLRMGYDNDPRLAGAGTVLLSRMLQNSFERGDRVFDLGADYLECKRPWLTRLATSANCSHFPSGVSRAQLLHAKRWLTSLFR